MLKAPFRRFVALMAWCAVVLALVGAWVAVSADAAAAATPATAAPAASAEASQSRGELLYSTHCIACHTTQIHWRSKRAAVDWASLKFQVRRWQGAASLGWSDADIVAVARYLNASVYRFDHKADRLSSAQPGRSKAVAGVDDVAGAAEVDQAPAQRPR